MNDNNKLHSTLPSNVEELLKHLQEQNIEEFAAKLVVAYMEKKHSK